MLQPCDHAQVGQLIARSFHLLDERDFVEWARCFTVDGVHESDGVRHRGRDAILDFVLRTTPVTVCLRLPCPSMVAGFGETAQAVTAYSVVAVSSIAPVTLAVGRCHDAFSRVGDEWLVRARRDERLAGVGPWAPTAEPDR